MKQSTLSIVQDLKEANQDFEWYPTTAAQIKIITDDIEKIKKDYDFTCRYREPVRLLDIGAGDGRVLEGIKATFDQEDNFNITTYAIEKAPIHTATYRKKDITLLGTEFNQINFISKNCEIAFCNPPYSEFSTWLKTLISHLNFGVLYAIIPKRWINDPAINEAMVLRGLKYTKVLSESDFLNAERAARAKVHVVRFSFDDLVPEKSKSSSRSYRPTIGRNTTDPFQLFIETELGLKKTYSQTTEKFSEYAEKERVRKEITTEGSASHELVVSKGILWALLDKYEIDLAKTLDQYKLISTIDSRLLQELGVCYDALRKGAKEKLLGYRNVYWSLLFEKLEALSERLTHKHKQDLLNKLYANALDFTYTNAVYIISYAVELGNELIEQSLLDVHQNLTRPDSISRYYKSNSHVYSDDWRYTSGANKKSKYLLDFRFIHSSSSNFVTESYKNGLNDGARGFVNDLMVAFKLLGYSSLHTTKSYDDMVYKDKLSVMGTTPEGEVTELVKITFYLNGNRHLKFNQDAMLRLNVTVSRLLGWVRNKEEFTADSGSEEMVTDNIWCIRSKMKISSNNVLMITSNVA